MKNLHPYQKRYPQWHFRYKLVDYFTAMVAWGAFFTFRKIEEIPADWFDWSAIYSDSVLYIGMFVIASGWLLFYILWGQYTMIFRRSRVMTLVTTFIQSVIGSLVLLVTVLYDDLTLDYANYLHLFLVLLVLHFVATSVGRWVYLTWLNHLVFKGEINFPTLIIGASDRAGIIARDLAEMPYLGFRPIEIKPTANYKNAFQTSLFTDIIFADEKPITEEVSGFMNELLPFVRQFQLHSTAFTSGIPNYFKTSAVPLTGLVSLDLKELTNWEKVVKRFFDIVLSISALIVLLPVILWIALKVRNSSKGNVIFRQERIGHLREPFQILKFRSMYEGAEGNGPLLSHDDDERCTPFGAFMRKWRLDEIPQFWNVIKGDMSLVGPRPERQFFIDQLKKEVPRYDHLLTVRPGITSLGQVKFGYASDLQQMLKRLKFDLIYVENPSLTLDFKILFSTLKVLLQGKGK